MSGLDGLLAIPWDQLPKDTYPLQVKSNVMEVNNNPEENESPIVTSKYVPVVSVNEEYRPGTLFQKYA